MFRYTNHELIGPEADAEEVFHDPTGRASDFVNEDDIEKEPVYVIAHDPQEEEKAYRIEAFLQEQNTILSFQYEPELSDLTNEQLTYFHSHMLDGEDSLLTSEQYATFLTVKSSGDLFLDLTRVGVETEALDKIKAKLAEVQQQEAEILEE